MSFIHYICLKNCLKSRIVIENCESSNIIFYTWSNYNCEICLTEYPKYIKHKSLSFNLIDFPNNFNQYILFDYRSFDEDKLRTVYKGLICVKIIDGEEISIVSLILISILGENKQSQYKTERYKCKQTSLQSKL